MAHAHFNEEQPEWMRDATIATAAAVAAASATPAELATAADDDPFAPSAAAASAADLSADADDDPFACFAEQLSVHPATAAAASARSSPPPLVGECPSDSSSPAPLSASPSSSPHDDDDDVAAVLPDSAEYVAALERRLARLHERRIKQQHKRHVPGSEFLSSAAKANHSHAFSSATSNWLDLEGDSAATAAAAANAVGSTDGATAAAAAAAHSSDEEGEDGAGPERARGPAAGRINHPIEERVSLLSQHEQLMEDSDIAQLTEAHKAAADALPAANAAADADSAQSSQVAGAPEDAQSSEADPTLSPSAIAATATASPSPSQPSSSTVAHRIESSDGDDTAAPVHMAVAGSSPASGVVPGRGLYYQSSAYAAQVAGWWEEDEKCVIA